MSTTPAIAVLQARMQAFERDEERHEILAAIARRIGRGKVVHVPFEPIGWMIGQWPVGQPAATPPLSTMDAATQHDVQQLLEALCAHISRHYADLLTAGWIELPDVG